MAAGRRALRQAIRPEPPAERQAERTERRVADPHLARPPLPVVPKHQRYLRHDWREGVELEKDVHHAGEPGLRDEGVTVPGDRPLEQLGAERAVAAGVV